MVEHIIKQETTSTQYMPTTTAKSTQYINQPYSGVQQQQQPLLTNQSYSGIQQPQLTPLQAMQGGWDFLFMNANRAIVQEKVSDTNLINHYKTDNLFTIQLSNGGYLIAREKHSRPLATLFRSNDPYTIRVSYHDKNSGMYRDFLTLRKPKKTFLGGNSLKVMDERKNILGSITKKFSLTSRKLVIKDVSNTKLFTLKAGKSVGKNYFEIYNNRLDKKLSVGEIRREWNENWWKGEGLNQQQQGYSSMPMQQQQGYGSMPMQQGYNQQQPYQSQSGFLGQAPPMRNEDTYAVQFPLQSSSFDKALILGAAFLIDFVFFDKK